MNFKVFYCIIKFYTGFVILFASRNLLWTVGLLFWIPGSNVYSGGGFILGRWGLEKTNEQTRNEAVQTEHERGAQRNAKIHRGAIQNKIM